MQKEKIKDIDELSAFEKPTYDRWHKALAKEINSKSLIEFLENEMKLIEDEWLMKETRNPLTYFLIWKKEIETKARLKNYKGLISLVKRIEAEKKIAVMEIKEELKKPKSKNRFGHQAVKDSYKTLKRFFY